MADAEVVMLYITVPSKEEGIRLGRLLIEDQLAACANVYDGATSIFQWDGAVQEENEALLFAKTTRNLIDPATDLLVLEHPYECPCVVAFPVVGGHRDFIAWVADQTGNADGDG